MIDEILKAVYDTFEKDKYIMSIAKLLDLESYKSKLFKDEPKDQNKRIETMRIQRIVKGPLKILFGERKKIF